MLKSIALAVLLLGVVIPAVVYTTHKEWQHLGFLNFSDEESKQYIAELGKRMATLPNVMGDWEFVAERPVNEEQIRVAKITKYQSRLYRHKTTGAEVSIFLSTGPRGEICIHTPNECNPASGDVPMLPDLQVREVFQLDESGAQKKNLGSFVWQRYRRSGQDFEFEIWWSYNEDGKWEGEKNPRMAFTMPGIYKLYVTGEKAGTTGGKNQEPPQLSFLRAFIPATNNIFFPPEKPVDGKIAAK